MSKYGIKYEIKFTNTEKHLEASPDFALDGQEIDIGIYDRSYSVDDSTDVVVHSLDPSGDPFHLQSVDNNEDKFTPIRAIQAKFQFLSTDEFNLATFTNSPPLGDDPGDPRWYVEVKIGSKFIFKGFLVLDDCFEAFMPTPNVVTLVAADGLSFLKDTALVDRLDLNPTGYNRIADYFAMALRKTGLSLNLNVVFNIQGAVQTVSGSTVLAQWVKIEYNSGSNIHYFLDFGAEGFYDVNIQPTPPPFPGSYTLADLTFVASGPANFALYILAHYSNWINGIQYTGDTADVSGALVWGGMGHLFDTHYVNAKTWEDKIGTSISSWDVIEKIFGEEAFLTQRCGEWWILRVDEVEENIQYNVAKFLSDGSYDSIIENSSAYGMFIGKDFYTIVFSDESTEVLQTPQYKFVKETYKLQNWLEILCNQDFDRGDLIASLPDEVIEGETFTALSYQIDCWKYEKSVPATTQDSAAYIKRLFDSNNYEKERYVHMEQAATNSFYYLRSVDKIPAKFKDKFHFSLSFRWGADLGGAKPYAVRIAQIRLYGNDGSFWNFGAKLGVGLDWYSTASGFPTSDPNFATLNFGVETTTSLTNWNTIDYDITAIPVSGQIEIILINTSNPDSQTYDLTNLSLTVLPYVNGSYQKFTSIYDKVERSINFRAVRDKEVFVSDVIHPLFKGGLFYPSSVINYTDNTDFQTDGTILVPGDRTNIFEEGFQFEIRNTGNNNRIFTVLSSSWDSGINFTTIVVREAIVPENDQPAEFYNVSWIGANKFFNWKVARTPNADQIHTYLHIQTFDVWNQYRNVMQVFRAQCWGLQSFVRDNYGEIDYPSLIHTYYLQDPHSLTYNRRFILLSFDQDWYKCEWKGTLAEVYKSDRPKSYEGTDGEEVKYE